MICIQQKAHFTNYFSDINKQDATQTISLSNREENEKERKKKRNRNNLLFFSLLGDFKEHFNEICTANRIEKHTNDAIIFYIEITEGKNYAFSIKI